MRDDAKLFINDYIEDLNGNDDYIDANCRIKAVILYDGKFYFGHTHGGILSHILTGTDTLNECIWRSSSIKYDREQKKVAFGNLIERNILIFEDTQTFWNCNEEESEDDFYDLVEITALLRSNKTELIKRISKAYTILRDDNKMYSSYNLDSLKQIL